MELKRAKIENFGKLSHREIEFRSGINLVSGANEAGKSTLYGFLKAMLFGLERGRGRAANNDDFTRYEPWEASGSYAGRLEFVCGETGALERRFCLERRFEKGRKNDHLFCVDDGEELSTAQGDLEMLLGHISQADFENTIAVSQMRVCDTASLASTLRDYAADYCTSGGGGIHLQEAQLLLKKQRKEKALQKLQNERRQEIQGLQRKIEYIEKEEAHILAEGTKVKGEMEKLRRSKGENPVKKSELSPMQKALSWSLFAFVAACGLLFSPATYRLFVLLAIFVMGEGLFWWQKKKEEELKRSMRNSGEDGMERLQRAEGKLEALEEELQEKRVEIENLKGQVLELEVPTFAETVAEKEWKVVARAQEILSEEAGKMQEMLTKTLNEKLSGIFAELTGGMYEKTWMDENMNLSVYGQGRKIPVERLSQGTIEQCYFALRMMAAEVLQKEELPVVLDDTFVSYDDVRLENTLKWLDKNKKQVILFSCQKREKELLQKSGIRFHEICL